MLFDTGLYDCRIYLDILDDFMRNSNFGNRSHIDYFFCDVISLLNQVLIVSFDRAYKEVSTKKYCQFSMSQFWLFDCTFKKQCTVPVTLTFNRW